MSVPMPEATDAPVGIAPEIRDSTFVPRVKGSTIGAGTQRKQPTYDYDAAIKRRTEGIGQLGNSANAYYNEMANKRIKSIRDAANAQMQNVGNLSSGEGFAYTGPGGNDLRSKLVKGAAAYQGVNYQWGGADPRGFDCSGLVQYVYGKMGVKMPRVSQQQAQQGKLTPVTNLKPGDLVGWGSSPATAHHIAVYAGNGMVWESPRRGLQVRLRRISPTERDIMGIALNLG